MLWLVKVALRKPYTVAVMAALIFVMGLLTIETTPTDIFPDIDIPVVNVVWFYQGLTPEDMTNFITTFSEFNLSQYVDNVARMESRTYYGLNVIRMYFQPGVPIDLAVSEAVSICQTVIKRMPLGTTPPYVLRYSAAEVPVIQLAVSGKTKSNADLFDYTWYIFRRELATIRGATFPPPWGGTARFIRVDAYPDQLLARGITAQELMEVINNQVLDYASGDIKIGDRDYLVSVNNVPTNVQEMNDIPIKKVNGQIVYMHDLGYVRDGGAVQWNFARYNGIPAVIMPLLKNGMASTLELVANLKKLLPIAKASAPEGIEIKELMDQSVFVRASVEGVVKEGLIAAGLTGIMILVFLGSWRSTLIVLTSIPLCILVALFILSRMGNTINIMTLGGLALAVGILVDDATVEVENIHRNHGMGKPLIQAILDGAQQIANAAFVATLSICIVFTSVIFLEGPPKYLFTPMALGVVFSMLFSYFLSRTLVPTMANMLIRQEEIIEHKRKIEGKPISRFMRFHHWFMERFEEFRDNYGELLKWALHHKGAVFLLFGILGFASFVALPFVGENFFPPVDAGKFRLHVFTPPGTRLETTARIFSEIEEYIKKEIVPEEEIDSIVDLGGLPFWFPAGMAFGDYINEGTFDGEILVSLKEDHHSTFAYMKKIREKLPRKFPGCEFFFQPPDMVNQILNFGSAAPIDIQVVGKDPDITSRFAKEIQKKVKKIKGAADVTIYQKKQPYLHLKIDRIRALDFGLNQREIANNILNQLSSSYVVAPNYWADPKTTINYPVVVQTPQHLIDSHNSLLNINLHPIKEYYSDLLASREETQLLSNVVSVEHTQKAAVVSHYNVKPIYNVFVNVQGRDLGGVVHDVQKVINSVKKELPPAYEIHIRGQAESMQNAFGRLGLGIVFAILMVYFLLVVNFQGWVDPFIILMALPAGFCGVIWMLYLTGTTFSVPSLMGMIMTVGVATSNSILLITFANEEMRNGADALTAAWMAGRIRLRPVLMTAGAMILGMLPMSLGLGEGGEQNAPLGRAVIGGMIFATIGTLFFVPVVFSIIRGKKTSPTE